MATRWANPNGHEMVASWFSVTFSSLFLSLKSELVHPAPEDVELLGVRMLTELATRFLEDNAGKFPEFERHDRPAEKLAAYLMGRWKNGMLATSCINIAVTD